MTGVIGSGAGGVSLSGPGARTGRGSLTGSTTIGIDPPGNDTTYFVPADALDRLRPSNRRRGQVRSRAAASVRSRRGSQFGQTIPASVKRASQIGSRVGRAWDDHPTGEASWESSASVGAGRWTSPTASSLGGGWDLRCREWATCWRIRQAARRARSGWGSLSSLAIAWTVGSLCAFGRLEGRSRVGSHVAEGPPVHTMT